MNQGIINKCEGSSKCERVSKGVQSRNQLSDNRDDDEASRTSTSDSIVIFLIFFHFFSKIHTQKIGQNSYCSRGYEELFLYQKLIGHSFCQCPDRPERDYPNPKNQ